MIQVSAGLASSAGLIFSSGRQKLWPVILPEEAESSCWTWSPPGVCGLRSESNPWLETISVHWKLMKWTYTVAVNIRIQTDEQKDQKQGDWHHVFFFLYDPCSIDCFGLKHYMVQPIKMFSLIHKATGKLTYCLQKTIWKLLVLRSWLWGWLWIAGWVSHLPKSITIWRVGNE